MGWAESIKWGVKTPAIVHIRERNDVEKQWEEQQQNEDHQQMKIQQQNEDDKQHHKNLLRDSPKQSTIAWSFWLLILKKSITESIIKKSFYIKNS